MWHPITPISSARGPACLGYNGAVSNQLAERLRLALDLYEAGERMMQQKLRRLHPDADDAEIERLLRAWLLQRPGAEHGDTAGKPCTWPRHHDAS